MDLSHLVHGMQEKKSAKKKPSSRGNTEGPSSSHSDGRHNSLPIRHDTPPGSSASHSQPHKQKSGDPPDLSSSPSQPRASSSRDQSGSSSWLQCGICERTFESRTKFDQHSKVFHGRSKAPSKPREAQFVCPDCGKGFTSPSKRNVHQNATHKGLRPFQCEVCSKSFGYKGDLTKHMATHSGVKAHSCYTCGARFSRNAYVKRHIETVHEKKGSRKKE